MMGTAIRRLAIVGVLCIVWQAYAMWLKNPLIFPTLTDTLEAGWQATLSGELPHRVLLSMRVLLIAYGAGIVLGLALATLAELTRIGGDVLAVLTAMFTPLPGIALMPVALLWFGLGAGGFVFVIVHSVIWPVAINTHAGFAGVPPTLRLVGRNYGLGGRRLTLSILMPAALPSILTGLRVGWAFAWRTLIAGELVFGVATGTGGLGWYISQARNAFALPDVFAGLVTVAAIGLIVESVIFRTVEALTVRRWGVQR
ncbi:MAG TPA: ABC transporter permease [Stellaceae bacterium]|jgi:NitT/TauT family transport system permease protein